MALLEELRLLELDALNERLAQTKEAHYQFFLKLDLSNLTQDQKVESLRYTELVDSINYVIGQKIYEKCAEKGYGWA